MKEICLMAVGFASGALWMRARNRRVHLESENALLREKINTEKKEG